jgi:7-cyano-7-deazaguanine tRNA-ribosyltransferase
VPAEGFDAVWRVTPPFGPFPRALSETYPLTAETPERHRDRDACEAAARGVARLVDANPDARFTLAVHDWPASALAAVPERVRVEDAASGGNRQVDEGDGDVEGESEGGSEEANGC